MFATATTNVAVAEFVPKGTIAKTEEQFPDLNDDEDEKPKKKGKGKKKQQAPPKEIVEVVDETTSFKGKPSTFFHMNTSSEPLNDNNNPNNYLLNDDQWQFIYLHYPVYAPMPYDMMLYCRQQAEMSEGIYGKPTNSGK
mmetsp:Transcript_12798/g.21651  ORF Transcript_12798/g.21651 Transcript_12798/m.21651 type:complete len:139 (+) Transcript_12798:405-821(+)